MSSTLSKIKLEVIGGGNDTNLVPRLLVGREKIESGIYCLHMCIITHCWRCVQTFVAGECVIGVSAARPTLVVKTENCLYIYMFGTCVFRIYTSCPICARCNIFILHVGSLLVHCCSRDKTSGQKGWTVGTNVTVTWKRWGKGGSTSKTETDC